MKQVEKQNETIKSLIQNYVEELIASEDKIYELELRLRNYEEGYSPPNSIRISNNNIKNEHSQSNTRWDTGRNNPNNSNNQQRNKAQVLEEVVEEIGIDGTRKWSRDWKQQRYVEVCKKTNRKKEAIKKRIEDARANGEQDPLFIKHRCKWEEQSEHKKPNALAEGSIWYFGIQTKLKNHMDKFLSKTWNSKRNATQDD